MESTREDTAYTIYRIAYARDPRTARSEMVREFRLYVYMGAPTRTEWFMDPFLKETFDNLVTK